MKYEIVFAGSGGQGNLFVGKVLATAAYKIVMPNGEHKQVTWIKSYGPTMRGGTSRCMVVVSDKKIACPVVATPDILVAMNRPSLAEFAKTVKENGLIVFDFTLIPDAEAAFGGVASLASGVEVAGIGASEIALKKFGNVTGANSVLLGAMLARRPVVTYHEVLVGMEALLKKDGKERFFESNKQLLDLGYLTFTK